MSSLYDDLAERLARDPSLLRAGGPRVDLSLLLFNAREELRELWLAADAASGPDDIGEAATTERLGEAVERLRPIFGEGMRPEDG